MGLFDKANNNNASKAKLKSLINQAFPDVEFMEDDTGGFFTREGSVGISIFINQDYGDGNNVLSVVGFTLFGARDDDKLYRHLLTNTDTNIFCHWVIESSEESGKVNVLTVQNLLMEDLDPAELGMAVYGVATTADKNDEELQKLFGGKRSQDQFEWAD